jgi:hypothetical protein
MWSKNWFMYSYRELGLSGLTLLLSCLLCLCIGKLLYTAYQRARDKMPGWGRLLLKFAFCTLIVSVLFFFLDLPLNVILPNSFLKFGVGLVLSCLITWIVLKNRFKPINTFLTICLVLFIGTATFNAIADSSSSVSDDNSQKLHVSFKKHPNIYLFLLESYHDLETMQTVYNIDTQALSSYLQHNNFTIYKNAYSSGSSTLRSMSDLFAMRSNVVAEKGNHDIDPMGRALIGGSRENSAYRILKENGYRTVYLADQRHGTYYLLGKGIYLDDTNLDFDIFQISTLRPLLDLNTHIQQNKDTLSSSKVRRRFRGTLLDNIRKIIKRQKNEDAPFYLGFKAGAYHTPIESYGYTWQKRNEWVASNEYQNAVQKGNAELFEIVDLIIKEDPSAVIALLGDHGSWRLRSIWSDVETKDLYSLDKLLKERGESLASLAKDIFGVLLAVRMPEGNRDISGGYAMSNVNLFRHIFAVLGDKPEILQDRAPTRSSIINIDLVREGVVQQPSDSGKPH